MFEAWPFTNFHDLNLDWIIKTILDWVKKMQNFVITMTDAWDAMKQDWTDYQQGLNDEWQEFIDNTYKDQITEILEDHPEWVTTVMDGSIDVIKLTSQAKLETVNHWVTPEQYGAAGDGLTDDTTAVNQAMQHAAVYLENEYLITSDITANSTVIIGPGTIIGGEITCNKNVYINGSTFKPTNTGISLTAGGVVINCTFDGGHVGLEVNDTDHTLPVLISSCVFKNMEWAAGYPAAGIDSLACDRITIENCDFSHIKTTSADADGVKVWQSADVENAYATIKDCNFSDIDGRFIKDSAYNAYITGCYGDNTGNTGVIEYCYSIDVQKGNATIESCNFTNVWGIGITRRSTLKQTVYIRDCTLHSFGKGSNKRPAVNLTNSDSNACDLYIEDSKITSDGQVAIDVNMIGDNVNVYCDGIYFATDDKTLLTVRNFTSAGGSLSVFNTKRNPTNTIKYFCATSSITGAEALYTDNIEGFFWVASGTSVPIAGLKKNATFYGKITELTTSANQYMIHAKPMPGTGDVYLVEIWSQAEHKVYNRNGVEL